MNERQRKAVTAPIGAVLILAGPGTDKMCVLTERTQAIKKLGFRLCQVNSSDRYEDCYVP